MRIFKTVSRDTTTSYITFAHFNIIQNIFFFLIYIYLHAKTTSTRVIYHLINYNIVTLHHNGRVYIKTCNINLIGA